MNENMLAHALKYAAMNMPIFPCVPKSKKPITENGFKDASVDPDQITKWWSRYPDANIGMPTGAASGIVVVDVDTRSGGDQSWDALIATYGEIGGTAYSFTGGGRHFFFRHPGCYVKGSTGEIASGIDVKGDGGYVILPPSIHPNGKSYGWELSSAITDVTPAPLPAWLAELLSESRQVAKPAQNWCKTAGDPLPDGKRNSTLASIAGYMQRAGIPDSAMYAALLEVNNLRCKPPLEAREVEGIVKSVSRYEPDTATTIMAEGMVDEILVGPTRDKIESPGPFPYELIERSPDIVKEVMEYYSKNAVELQPVLMLASLIAATGAVLGHKVKDASGLRTNIYTVGITTTGGGKEMTREIIGRIFHRADLDDMCGPEDFASDSGLIAILEKQNPILFQIDEFGRHLQCVNAGPQKNPYLYNVGSVLLKLYGKANSRFRSKAYADVKKNRIINNPHVCLYGTSVRTNFWKAMNIDSLEGGFLPRLLVFHDYGEPQTGGASECPPPDRVVEFFNFWGHRRITGGNLEQAGTNVINPNPMIVPFTERGAQLLNDFKLYQKQRQKKYDGLGALWSRARENAGKLALIYSAWANPIEPVVDEHAAQWAIDVTRHVVQYTLHEASLCLAEGPFHQMCQLILQAIDGTSAAKPMTKSSLTLATRNLKPKEREEAIETLKEQGLIDSINGRTPSAKKDTTFYWRI